MKQSHSQFHLQKSHANTEVTSILGMSESSVPEIQEKLDLVDQLSSGEGKKKQQINCASQVCKKKKIQEKLDLVDQLSSGEGNKTANKLRLSSL